MLEHTLHIGEGFRADLGDLQLFIEMGPEGKQVSIYDRRKKTMVLSKQRPKFSWEDGLEPNLQKFRRFVIEQAHGFLRRPAPSDDDILAVAWRRHGITGEAR